jgi:uncharacterized membrane protein YfcA
MTQELFRPTEQTVVLLCVGLAMVFLSGLIRGFTGFGFAIAAVPLLSLLLPPAQAVPIVLVMQLLVGLVGLREAIRLCDWRSVRLLTIGATIATPLGVWGLAHLPSAPVRAAIAAIVLLSVAVLGRGARLQRAPGAGGVLSFGALAGLFNGLAGMPGPPVIAFYLAAPMAIAVGRASMIVFFLASSVVALVPVAALGMLSWPVAIGAVLGFPMVWFGSWLGAIVYSRSRDRGYRMVALALLVATALLAAIRAGFDLFS